MYAGRRAATKGALAEMTLTICLPRMAFLAILDTTKKKKTYITKKNYENTNWKTRKRDWLLIVGQIVNILYGT